MRAVLLRAGETAGRCGWPGAVSVAAHRRRWCEEFRGNGRG